MNDRPQTTGRICPNMVRFTCYNPACRYACARDPLLDRSIELKTAGAIACAAKLPRLSMTWNADLQDAWFKCVRLIFTLNAQSSSHPLLLSDVWERSETRD